MINSVRYAFSVLMKADKKAVIYSLYKHCSEEFINAFFAIFFVKKLYDYIDTDRSFSDIVLLIGVFCGIQIVVHTVSAGHAYYIKVITPRVYSKVYKQVIDKALTIPAVEFENPVFYDKYSRALDESLNKLITGVNDVCLALGNMLAVITSFVLVAFIDPVLLLLLVPMSFIVMYCTAMQAKYKFKLRDDETVYKREMEYYKRVFYEKKYSFDLRLSDIKHLFDDRYADCNDDRYKLYTRYNRKMMIFSLLSRVICVAGVQLVAFIYISWRIKDGNALQNISGYIAIVTTMQYIVTKINSVLQYGATGAGNCMYMNNMKDFMEYSGEVSAESLKTVEEGLGDIRFENVSFAYDGKNNILDSLDLTIKKGEKIALVGENGAGKTTLVKLLLGFYKVNQGSITVGGTDVQELDKDSYYKRVGTVFQDHQVFAMSLAQNVIMKAEPDVKDIELVHNSLKMADFNKTEKLESGVDTNITKEFDDKGYVCSGGESQKIAIARAYAKNPDLLILDEPSSALDPVAEFYMFYRLQQVTEGKTALIISHRLSSTKLADRIVFLENGKIVESGTHDELMELNGKYASLYRFQARNYKEGITDEQISQISSAGLDENYIMGQV